MKAYKTIIALFCCTLTAACTGEVESDEITLDDAISGSTYRQALHPNGNVDCATLHDALEQHGIDPALLDPDVVFQACVGSGDVPEDLCSEVAHACFGPQGCGNGTPPTDPPDDICDEVYRFAGQNGVDPSQVGADEVFQQCVDAGLAPDLCAQASQCFPGPNGNPGDPNGTEICDLVIDEAGQMGIDLTGSPDELFQACRDAGYDDQLCQSIIDQCLNSNGNTGGGDPTDPNGGTDPNNGMDPTNVDCASIEDQLNQNGFTTPLDNADAQALFEECLQVYDEDLCIAALQCVSP